MKTREEIKFNFNAHSSETPSKWRVKRKQTSFRLSENLLQRLQIEAKRHNRSLNNLVESVLLAFVSEKPNKTTLAAMKEAETTDNLETLDLSNFRNFVDSL